MINKVVRSVLFTVLLFVMSFAASGQGVTQQYAQGKVFLTSGITIEGKSLRMSMEFVTINVSGQDQIVALADVVQVMAKKGKGKKFGTNCAASCVGANLGLLLASGGTALDANGDEYDIDVPQYLLSAALWGGISYGIGYVAGMVSDDWEVVYLNRG